MKTLALVPLRGGSKSIPGKNIKEIGGKPLCAWVLEAACGSDRIDDVYVSTDSAEIEEVVVALDLGIKIIRRPARFATDEASTESVMLHFMEQVSFDLLATIQATSPLLGAEHLDAALLRFTENNYDSMLSAVRLKRFFWEDDGRPMNYDPHNRPRRQDFSGTLMENGAFYITRRNILEEHRCRLGGHIGVFEMPEETAVEIDEPGDWQAVAELLKNR